MSTPELTSAQRQESLLDGEGFWRYEPMVAFESLIKAEAFRRTNRSTEGKAYDPKGPSSVVYKAMFNKALKHLAACSIAFVDAQEQHIRSFLEPEEKSKTGLKDVTKETAWRYVRLLERTYDHLVEREIITSNPVSAWIQKQLDDGESPRIGRDSNAPDLISRADVCRLQDWLTLRGTAELAQGNWRAARDITLASVSLGSGMRCTELLKLERKQVKHWPGASRDLRFEFDIPRGATVATAKEHGTMADESCVDLMEKWWSVRWTGFPSKVGRRSNLPVPGVQVFPRNLKGQPLNPSTLFNNLKDLARHARAQGILNDSTDWVLRRGAQGLRRAYALSELQAGAPDALLTYRLGHHDHRGVKRIRGKLA